jgi:hypothetical protein
MTATTANPPAPEHPRTPKPDAKQRYWFVGVQIGIIGPSSRPGESQSFQARIHLNRRLPADAEGVFADIRLAGVGPDSPAVPFGKRSRHC